MVEKINLETRLYNQSRQPGFFGQSLEPKVIHVLNHCMSYDLLDLGNCSNRAAFAAFKLYDLLKDTPIKLHIKGVDNSGNIDHVVTYIGNSSLGWFIYDPLTNPLIVFAFDEYKTTIMPLFKSSIRKVRSFEVKMSDMLVEKYAIIYPQYREIMLKRIDDLCAIDLLKDPNLISSIEEKDQSLTKEQINKLVIIGCLALKARCADLMQPTSQENTDLVAAASSPLKK